MLKHKRKKQMIKTTSILLITLSLMSVTYSITPAELHKAFITCDNQTRIVSQCSTNPLNKTAYGKGADKCADDYYKSWICFNAFSSCTKSIADLKSTEDVIFLWIKNRFPYIVGIVLLTHLLKQKFINNINNVLSIIMPITLWDSSWLWCLFWCSLWLDLEFILLNLKKKKNMWMLS